MKTLLVLISLLFSQASFAAEIMIKYNAEGQPHLSINGEIVPGDFDTVIQTTREIIKLRES